MYTTKDKLYKSCIISLILITLFTGCSSSEVTGAICIERDNNKYTFYDGTYIYTKEGDMISNKKKPTDEVLEPAMYVMSTITDYSLDYLRPNTYHATYDSFCGYYNNLLENGFSLEEFHSTYEMIDCILKNYEGVQTRLIYTKNEDLKIFTISLEQNQVPNLYINRKE